METLGYFVIHSVTCLLAISIYISHVISTLLPLRRRRERETEENRRKSYSTSTSRGKSIPVDEPSTMQLMALFFVFHRPPRFQCAILRRWQPSAALVFVPEANGIAGVRPNGFEPFFSGDGGLNGGLGERGEGGAAPATGPPDPAGPPADLVAEVVERWRQCLKRRRRCSEQE